MGGEKKVKKRKKKNENESESDNESEESDADEGEDNIEEELERYENEESFEQNNSNDDDNTGRNLDFGKLFGEEGEKTSDKSSIGSKSKNKIKKQGIILIINFNLICIKEIEILTV